ncbi:MAG: mechanosensitive ion channel domain-containing protein [Candidatus Nanohalobium sp.]
MADPVSSLLILTTSQQPLIHILFTLLIIVAGHAVVKALKIAARKTWLSGKTEKTKKWIKQQEERIEITGNVLDAVIIAAALFYLNTGITTELFKDLQAYLPRFLTVLLIGVLGVIIIRILTQVLKNFLQTTGVRNYIRETGLSINSIKLLVGSFKAFLYLLLFQVLVSQLNIGSTFISEIINASSWALAFLVAGLLLYGFKDLFQNFAAGVYLKNSRIVRPGEEVKLDDDSGEIRDVSLFSTTVNTNSGYTVLAPNREIMQNNLKFKRAKSDLDTLEDISNYFIAERPGYSAAASLEMALEILGFRKGQNEIQDKIKEQEAGEEEEELSEVEKIQETVSELTNHHLNSAWIEQQKIDDIGDEIKAWFNDEGLVILKMRKDVAGGNKDEIGYVLATGVEDNEILLVDPAEEGVYYVHKDKLEEALEFDGGGYIVVAPEGTTAFWRIKNDLIYSRLKDYEEGLSKTLESRLRKIVRQGRIVQDVTPESVQEYLEKWRSDETSALLWKPGEEKGEKDEEASEDN